MESKMDDKSYVAQMLERSALFLNQAELDKIRNTIFGIAGLGGVGAITAELLARWGVKKFRLLDKDRYDHSNLNRQLFATSDTIGRYKAEVAAERIKAINPFADINMTVTENTNNENVPEFVKGAGMILQMTDHPSSLLLYEAARKYKIPLVNGHATITGCRVMVYDFKKSDCLHWIEKIKNKVKWKGQKPITKMTPQELDDFDRKWVHSTAASLNFVTNAVGCLAVSEAVKLITRRGKNAHYPKQIDFDLFDLRFRVRNTFSFLSPDNYRRFISLFNKNSL